ncbi:ABC transporter substrate-binding protein [Bradyrhizobium jicamae]|uniref:ABC transporter substrate-binding protein n=1 Tax=Bradyrhizobium jicamae TaxID=280332 RepID=A0ABS5FLF9_9BRAD|nr:ABC transporter substrate-binding protein [Bradyrhizobium jicamae]MBR0797529.1 ABC transporter substrate-binding protein [Bradyrhizobium jicamae]
MPAIGLVAQGTWKGAEPFFARLRQGLAEYGFVEGKNFRFELREANYQFDRLPALYRELADQKVSVMLAETTAKLEAAKAATQSIPIVFVTGIDPVENGFIASFSKPGANITGIFNLTSTLIGKELEILHELVPAAKKFAFLTDPGNMTLRKLSLASIQAAADSLGLNLLNVNAHVSSEFEAAIETAVRAGAGGMILGPDILFNHLERQLQLVNIAARYRLPTIYFYESTVRNAGGLIGYGSDPDEGDRAMGRYAGRILKGEKPADMPATQPTKTILIINLKTAKALGITVPTALLVRADEVIE